MNYQQALQNIALMALPLIFAITLHEAAHGWVANKFGDKTALMMGRVTLNPIKHIDPFGTIILPCLMLLFSPIVFGWAKPVPVTWQNLRNPRRDMALVALAGPGANLLMALLWAAIAKLCFTLAPVITSKMLQVIIIYFFKAGLFGIFINVILMLLNLIPIPPLDGSRVVSSLLPPRAEYMYSRIEPYGIWILFALLVFGFLGRVLTPGALYVMKLIRGIFGL